MTWPSWEQWLRSAVTNLAEASSAGGRASPPTVAGDGPPSPLDEGLAALPDQCIDGLVEVASDDEDDTRLPYVLDEVQGFYVVSLRPRSRKLHVIGGCHRIPGVDYAHYTLLGPQRPRETLYSSFCRHCWPEGLPTPVGPPSPSTSPGSSDSGQSLEEP